jgi:hypothetical protein
MGNGTGAARTWLAAWIILPMALAASAGKPLAEILRWGWNGFGCLALVYALGWAWQAAARRR